MESNLLGRRDASAQRVGCTAGTDEECHHRLCATRCPVQNVAATPNLLPCPFCGAGKTLLQPNGRVWSGDKYSDPISVSVHHWCEERPGQPSRMIERIGRDERSAIDAWNQRARVGEPDVKAAPLGAINKLVKWGASDADVA